MAWLSDYSYRKEINITGETGASTDYQVKLLIGESSGATGEDFDVAEHSEDFPAAKDDGGETELDFWVESVSGTTPNQLATVWVEVADDLGSNQSIYCYYGNSGATNGSSGDDTFTLFDDFGSVDTVKWTVTGSPTVSSSIITCLKDNRIASKSTFGNTIALRARVTDQGAASFDSGMIGFSTSSTGAAGYSYDLYGNYPTSSVINGLVGGSTGFTMGNDGTTPHIYDALRSGSQCEMLSDGVSKGTLTSGSTASLYLRISGDGNPGLGNTLVDWLFIRKYQATEPAFSTAESEEDIPAGDTGFLLMF